MNESPVSALILRAASRYCALGLTHVIEILRPLPLEELPGAPEPVSGVSIIRGIPVPVVDLACFLKSTGGNPTRLVLVRSGEHCLALAVEEVFGVGTLSSGTLN